MKDRVTISDCRKGGFCVRGMKQWWESQEAELPTFREFLKEGLDMDIAERLEDPFAQRSVEIAKARIAEENSK